MVLGSKSRQQDNYSHCFLVYSIQKEKNKVWESPFLALRDDDKVTSGSADIETSNME